jgi:cephalosporin-C deacetylase-like acetyl esterase
MRIVLLFVAAVSTAARAQKLAVTPYDPSGIYGVNETVGWTIRVADGQHASAGVYTYVVKENGGRPIKNGSLDLTQPATIETALSSPGMIRVEIRPPMGAMQTFGNINTGGNGVVVLGAAVDPTKIQPVLEKPSDFDAFWDAKLKLLARVPMGAVVTPKESGVADVDYSTVRLDNIGGAHVYTQIARPKRAGKFPAIVIYQWASAPYPLEKSWVTDRAKDGWLAINVEPHDVPLDMPPEYYASLPQMIKDYAKINNTDRDHNYFLQMYLGDYRAIEYLASLADWDGRTLVVNGISMGGQQSLAVAGLNPRVTAIVVNVPAGGDANGAQHGRQPGYPNWDMSDPRVAETARYFDVVNFASRIKAPVMAAMGFIDDVTPAIGIWTVLNQIPGVKEPVPMIDSPHNHQATPAQLMPYTLRSEAWLKALLNAQPVPPR